MSSLTFKCGSSVNVHVEPQGSPLTVGFLQNKNTALDPQQPHQQHELWPLDSDLQRTSDNLIHDLYDIGDEDYTNDDMMRMIVMMMMTMRVLLLFTLFSLFISL